MLPLEVRASRRGPTAEQQLSTALDLFKTLHTTPNTPPDKVTAAARNAIIAYNRIHSSFDGDYDLANPNCIGEIWERLFGDPPSEEAIVEAASKAGLSRNTHWFPPSAVVEVLRRTQRVGLEEAAQDSKHPTLKEREQDGEVRVVLNPEDIFISITRAANRAHLSPENLNKALEEHNIVPCNLNGRRGSYIRVSELTQAGIIPQENISGAREAIVSELKIGPRTLGFLCHSLLRLPPGTDLSPEQVKMIKDYLAEDKNRIQAALKVRTRQVQMEALKIAKSAFFYHSRLLRLPPRRILNKVELEQLMASVRSM